MRDEGDGKIDRIISRLLQVGVLASLCLVATGTVIGLARPEGFGSSHEDLLRLTGAGGEFPRHGAWLWHGIVHGNGSALIVLGLLLLIGTPVMRVAVSIITFAIQKDRAFLIITMAVLGMLVMSFLLGHR